MYPPYLLGTVNDYATGTNANATITYTALTNYRHIVAGIAWSYSGATLTGGNLMIQDGSTIIFNLDVTSLGAGFIPFDNPKAGSINKNFIITLAAGGSTTVGKLNILGHLTLL